MCQHSTSSPVHNLRLYSALYVHWAPPGPSRNGPSCRCTANPICAVHRGLSARHRREAQLQRLWNHAPTYHADENSTHQYPLPTICASSETASRPQVRSRQRPRCQPTHRRVHSVKVRHLGDLQTYDYPLLGHFEASVIWTLPPCTTSLRTNGTFEVHSRTLKGEKNQKFPSPDDYLVKNAVHLNDNSRTVTHRCIIQYKRLSFRGRHAA